MRHRIAASGGGGELTMAGRELISLLQRASLVAGALALTSSVHAEPIKWPWQQQRPVYRQAPAQRTVPNSETSDTEVKVIRVTPTTSQSGQTQTYSSAPQTSYQASPQVTSHSSSPSTFQSSPQTTSQPAPQATYQTTPRPATAPSLPAPAAQPKPQSASSAPAGETQRKPQPVGAAAASAQAAAPCMNERKSASVEAAIKSCDAVIDETLKNLANAYYFRGNAKFGKSDLDGALGDYGQALRLDPSDVEYLGNRAAVYEARNDMPKAMADYDQGIKGNPNSAVAYGNRGAAFQRKGNFAKAAADYGE
jgi:tetratricopeptide (TPR) repeat protein